MDNYNMDCLSKEERQVWESLKKYKETTSGSYGLVTVEGLSYINYASDILIMGSMYNSGMNWAHDDMLRFHELSEEFYKVNKSANIFFDIGANIGTTCIYFKKKIDPSIEIIAFEPSEENYKMLDINMRLNDINEEEYRLEKLAVSDSEGETAFSYDKENSGGSRLVLNAEKPESVVKTISFDIYMKKYSIDPDRIKYIWVDIEGAEPFFFFGAMETLQKISVPIVVEFSPSKYREEGCYIEYVDLLCHLYDSFVYMHDEKKTVHPVDELYRYEDSEQLVDLFLIKGGC